MSSTELARELSNTAAGVRRTGDDEARRRLRSLCLEAVAHVARVGTGTVDHIVLSSALKPIVADAPELAVALDEAGWTWFR